MLFRRARLAAFWVLLTIFSANYFLWLYRAATGQSAQSFYRRHQTVGSLQYLSQFLRVYDTPYFFNPRQEVLLTYFNGRSEIQAVGDFSNPLDTVAFSHIWYWLDANNPKVIARKERLLRARFCRPGVQQIHWTMHYLDQPLAVDLGQIGC